MEKDYLKTWMLVGFLVVGLFSWIFISRSHESKHEPSKVERLIGKYENFSVQPYSNNYRVYVTIDTGISPQDYLKAVENALKATEKKIGRKVVHVSGDTIFQLDTVFQLEDPTPAK